MAQRKAWSLKTYRAASSFLKPVANYALQQRLRAGKEDPHRLDERRGQSTSARPEGKVLWLHGASVGESLSILPLVQALKKRHAGLSFLVTTGTVTSAELMAKRLPPHAIHQYVPVDQPQFVRRFFDHWRPDAALFVESELWPVMLGQAHDRGVPMALINARMSPKSFQSWQSRKRAAQELLSVFDVIIAQNEDNADRFKTLSGRPVEMLGNLKYAAEPLPAAKPDVEQMQAWLGDRGRWLAASTHEGEEIKVLSAHRQILLTDPHSLLILAPRHPARGDEIEELCKAQDFKIARRSKKQPVTETTEIYLADTLGELGVFYSLCDVAFVGGSLAPIGGHNPLEPARLGCAILHGEEIFNFADTYKDMRNTGSAGLVRNERDLAASLERLLSDAKTRQAMANAARAWSDERAKAVLDGLIDVLDPVLSKGGITR
ncbi:MAG: 3-deoxy-D-manno-octulosonic acid transferase [Pseudomonadota bacterium]